MEFTGQIKELLPARSGTSQRTGNEWKSQPFIFEYFENPTDRYADSVMLETFDTNIMSQLEPFAKVRIGFGLRVRKYTGQDGVERVINDFRIYKFERYDGQKQPAQTTNGAQSDNHPQPRQNTPAGEGNGEGGGDDLPF